MDSYDYTDVYSRIIYLEDKVNRLEEIISYGNRDQYAFTPLEYNRGKSSHYKSAIRLSNATQNFKQDLIHNPRHKNLNRKDYRHIYDRVSILEKELDDIVQNMNYKYSQKSNYDYVGSRRGSMSYYDEPPQCLKRHGIPPRTYITLRAPERKHILYNEYFEEISDETSSSESIDEIVYYVESSPSSSSSSSIIVEEYVPKNYTRRSVRKAPFIDVSKSKPRSSAEKSPLRTKKSRKRSSEQEISDANEPKIKKSKKEKKSNKTDNLKADDSPSEKSEIFLVKRSKEDPKNDETTNKKGKKDKFFVSRLKRVKSSGAKESDELHEKPPEQKPQANIGKSRKRTSERKDTKQQQKSNINQNKEVKSIKNNKRKDKERRKTSKQPAKTVAVAHSSFVLNDPFVRTIYYDDLYSSGEESKISSNLSGSNLNRVDQSQSKKSELGANNIRPSYTQQRVSIYEMGKSVYSFDPFSKRKEKFYLADKRKNGNFSLETNNSSDKFKIIHNVNKNDIVVLNDDELKPNQQKFTFKKSKKSRNIENVLHRQKEKGTMTDNKCSNSFDSAYNKSKREIFSKPIAHSVYLTTVPVYQTNLKNFQLLPQSLLYASNGTGNQNIFKTQETTSQKRFVIEDEILINVAKKLSPVLTKIINGKTNELSMSQEINKTESETSTKIDNHDKSLNYFYRNSDPQAHDAVNETKVRIPVENNNIKYHRQPNSNSRKDGSEIFIGTINSSDKSIRNPLIKNYDVYFAGISGSNKKSGLKKIKSLASVSRLFSKTDPQQSNIEKKSKDSLIEARKRSRPTRDERRRSTVSNIKENFTNPQIKSTASEEGALTVLLRSAPSLSNVQNINPRESTVEMRKSKSQSGVKKTGSRIKSMFSRTKAQNKDKTPSKTKEPALKSILSKMKSTDKSTKNLKKESQELLKSVNDSLVQPREKEPANLVTMKRFSKASKIWMQDQPLESHPRSTVKARHSSDYEQRFKKSRTSFNEPKINRINDEKSSEELLYSGSREYLKNVRSVSGYFDRPQSASVSQIIKEDTQLRLNETESMPETLNNIPSIKNIPENMITIQDGQKENPKTIPDITVKPKEPLQFCIHFSKEKRSKFESQSVTSLDEILFSQCKKIYSTEDLSLSEYAYDKSTESYKYKKIKPKKMKRSQNQSYRFTTFPRGLSSTNYGLHKNDCCCKNNITNDVQLITGTGSPYVDWHKVADEIKEPI